MEEKYNILDQLKKSARPKVPAGFFDDFYPKLQSQLESTEVDVQVNKNQQPEVPKDFFANFSSDLMDKIKSEEPGQNEPARVWPMKLVGFITAVAACALIFFMIQPNEEQVIAETAVESEQEEEDNVDSYLAYLDEDEIVDFLLENEDIEISEEFTADEEDEYYFLEEDLEEYYLEEL